MSQLTRCGKRLGKATSVIARSSRASSVLAISRNLASPLRSRALSSSAGSGSDSDEAASPADASHRALFGTVQDAFTRLDDCGVLRVSGKDAAKLLQNLITNDVGAIDNAGVGYAAFLNQKGRFLFDALISVAAPSSAAEPAYFLQTNAQSLAALQAHLKKFTLRLKASVQDCSASHKVWSVMSQRQGVLADVITRNKQDPARGLLAFIDPRVNLLGARLVLPAGQTPSLPDSYVGSAEPMPADVYDTLRMLLGVPDGDSSLMQITQIGSQSLVDQSRAGVRDMQYEKSLPLECNLDQLNAINFNKGCYLGQELTARTHFQGLVRKRLLPAYLELVPPQSALDSPSCEVQQATPSAIVRELAAEQAQTLPTSGLYAEEGDEKSNSSDDASAKDKQQQAQQAQAQTQTQRESLATGKRGSQSSSSSSSLLFAPFRFLDPFFPEDKLPAAHANVTVASSPSASGSSASASSNNSAAATTAPAAGTIVSTKFNCALVMQRLESVQSALSQHQPGQLTPVLAPRFRVENSADCGVVPVIPPWWPALTASSASTASASSAKSAS